MFALYQSEVTDRPPDQLLDRDATAFTRELVEGTVRDRPELDELIAALQEGTLERWRARYRAAGALIIDDVQFAAGKERTQEELFHVFNVLHTEGKQIVLTSDRGPKELEGLEERLRSRFEGGLVVGIEPPDRALREKLYARYLSMVEPPAEEPSVAPDSGPVQPAPLGIENRLG